MTYHPINHHYHLLRMREMGRIYWCQSIGALGISLVAIFVPIFLLKIGFSFTEVLVFLLLQQLFAALLQYHAARLMTYLKPHYQLALGNIWYAVFFALLLTLPTYHWPLYLLAFVWALNRTTYWAAFHYCFGIARSHKNSGQQIAGVNALNMIATTIAPAIGGIIATVFTIHYVYAAAICLLVIASLPVLFSLKGPKRPKLHMTRKVFRAIRRDAIANMFNGIILMAELSIWPLFVYFLVSSYAGVGLLSSIVTIASVVVTLYVGNRHRYVGDHHYIRRGIATYSLTSMGRALAENAVHVFGLNLLGGIGRSLYVTPYMNRYYTNSDGRYRLGYIAIMEGAFSVGATIYIAGLLVCSAFMSVHAVLALGLGIVALCTIGVRLIR